MKHLAKFREFMSLGLPQATPDKLFVMVENGKDNDGQLNYVVKLLLIDYRDDPFFVLILVRRWLRATHRIIEPDIVPVIGFDCEVIDSETYDLEITIPLDDKIVDDGDDGYHICATPIWDEALGRFVTPKEECDG